MTLYRRTPRRLSVTLSTLRHDWVPDSLLGEVQQRWETVVGPQIASAARPVSERGGVVTVNCYEATWANELDLLAPTLLERLNTELAKGSVTRLRCVVDAR